MSNPPAELTVTMKSALGVSEASVPGLALEMKRPGGDTTVHPLGLRPLRVGTSPECEVPCVDPRVSRLHCEVSFRSEGLLLTDLGSKNGTWVAGIRVQQIFLRPGVEVAVGGCTFTLTLVGSEQRFALAARSSFGGALGASMLMRALFAQLEQVARTEVSVLFSGESGVGKDVLARALHDESARREEPFLAFECSAVTPSLATAEIFGHERGAFTGADGARPGVFELAAGGTLLLDDVGEMPLELQPLLLRVLEEGQVRRLGARDARAVSVRVVATSQTDLAARVKEGSFRRDLFFRLAGVECWVPPLRDRKEDLPLLVEHFLGQLVPPRQLADLPSRTLERFTSYPWPGNVRELKHAVQRTVLFPQLDVSGAPLEPLSPPKAPYREAREAAAQAFERRYVEEQLEAHAGNVAATAEAMGVSRQFVYRLLTKHELSLKGPR